MPDYLILCEAGDKIGFGHYTRCQSIFESLLESKNKVHWLCKGQVPFITPEQNFSSYDWQNNLDELLERSKDKVVIIDSYLATLQLYEQVKSVCFKLVVLDDFGRLPYPADLIINPNITSDPISYSSEVKVLQGADFVILRSIYRDNTGSKEIIADAKTLLVSVGGSDVRHLLPLFMTEINWEGSMHILAGNPVYAAELESINRNENIQIHSQLSAEEMYQLMLQSDIAISACGQMMGELTYLGVPSLGIVVEDDQIPNANSYFDSGVIPEILNWDDSLFFDKMNSHLEAYQDYALRKDLSELGTNLIDGKGVEKIVKEISLEL